MRFDCVERVLRRFFFNYGRFIAAHPLPFLLIPLAIATGLTLGLMFITSEESVEELYIPDNSQAISARRIVEGLYADVRDDQELPAASATRLGPQGQIIIRPKRGDNVLTIPVMTETLRLHNLVLNISAQDPEKTHRWYNFFDLCWKWRGECSNGVPILEAIGYNATQVQSRSLTYPFASTPSGHTLFIGYALGDVELQPNSDELSRAGLMLITYPLKSERKGEIWEDEFIRQVSQFDSDVIKVSPASSKLFEKDIAAATDDIYPFIAMGFMILVIFAIGSTTSLENVRSKPWLGALGVISSFLAIGSGFGVMAYTGVPFAFAVTSSPFLVLGIGIDDMFLMVAAWRRTSVQQPTKDRMGEAFSNAAMSITITSITDALAFGIGATTTFRSVRLFCAYTGVCVLFDYFYQITFFAACMVLTGYREENNRHAVTCRKVLPKDQAPSLAYRICCAGGTSQPSSMPSSSVAPGTMDMRNERKDGEVMKIEEDAEHMFMSFFKKYYGPFITYSYVAYTTVFLYFIYLGVIIWGVVTLDEGIEIERIAPDGSMSREFFNLYVSNNFRTYGIPVSIVVTEELQYSNRYVEEQLNDALSELEDSDYFHGYNFTVSWLREYRNYLKLRDSVLGSSLTAGHLSEDLFIQILQEEFLRIEVFKKFIPDIVFSNGTIISSRFHVLPRNTESANRERYMTVKARNTAKDSSLPLIAYNELFFLFDQYIEIRPSTIQNVGIALGTMFIVSLVLIPNLTCAVLVTLSLISIVCGVVGFMSHWDIPLDSISMTNLIICIGFSVDFSAHITYAFVSIRGKTPRERTIKALYAVGMPITQAALSTILACFILEFTNSYLFRVFFRTMFLVTGLGALHGLVFLPVFLMLLVPRQNEQSDSRLLESIQ